MPVQRCRLDGKPGYRWGKKGKCYTYTPGNAPSRARAKAKAAKQGLAIGESDEEGNMAGKKGAKGAWQLPHHLRRGPLAERGRRPVDWALTGAAAIAVQFGRSGKRLLEATLAQRVAAARHLADHYREAHREVPEGLAAFVSSKGTSNKLDRGMPLEESAGSLTQYLTRVGRDFRAQFVHDTDEWWGFVTDVYLSHVVVYDHNLPDGQYWMVAYWLGDDEHFVFAPRDEWVKVELTYQLTGELSERKRFTEVLTAAVVLEEATKAGQPRFISGVGVTADLVNANRRRYPFAVLQRAVQQAISRLNESTGQGRIAYVLGEAEHPSDKDRKPQFLETIVNWIELELDQTTKQVAIRGRMIESSKGKDAVAVMDGGVLPGISMRSYGVSHMVQEANGTMVEEVLDLVITGFDLLVPGEQADPNGAISILERRIEEPTATPQEEGSDMDPEQVLQLLEESGMLESLAGTLLERIQAAQAEEVEGKRMQLLREALEVEADSDIVDAVSKLIAEANRDAEAEEIALRERLGVAEGVSLGDNLQERLERLQVLEAEQVQRKVAEYVESTIAALKYPKWMKDQLTEAVNGAEPKTVEEATALIASRRKEYSGMLSRLDLAAQGNVHGLEVLGPVIERELGIPAFAVVSHEITEKLRQRNLMRGSRPNLTAPVSINDRFAAQYLQRFDRQHKHRLLQESRLFAEAEQTSDLDLPYSVARAIIAEAIPTLVATSIYDVAMTDQADTRVYYEAYTGETGETVTVAAEDFTSDEGAWVQLDYKRIVPGTLSVEPDGGGTPWVEGTDYVMDYANGRIWTLAAGGIGDSTATEIDYDYKAFRLGEMAAIQQGKGSLSYKTLAMVADRLATEISTEAVLFSRSQVGWDATARTLSMLVFEIQRKIDQDLLYMALAGALIVASNSGGTWNSASDTIADLIEKIGVAKVLVGNRYYMPDHISCSLTNSDRIANWDGFAQAGQRPDSDLNANGFVGRLKGLPVFESTEHSDAYIIVANREIVHHRVFQPMIIKGPYPSYDVSGGTSKLLPSEQYYAEEFNGSDAPVPEKASSVKIT